MSLARPKAWVKSSLARAHYGLESVSTYAPQGSIILFHRICDLYPGDSLTVSTQGFDRYLRLFRAYFDVIGLEDFVGRLTRGESLQGKMALSFDDGYLDNYENAAAILDKHSLPCTFFITTNFIGSGTVPWWDQDLPVTPKWMSWSQVKELSKAGFGIGSHTLSHPDLGKVGGNAAREEIFESKALIESHVGSAVRLFSYPYGRRNQMTEANRELVREAGYLACFSAYGGLVPAGTDPYHMERQPVSDYHLSAWMFLYELRKLQVGK